MKRAGILLCTLPVLAQEAKTLHPSDIIFYAQTEPTELGLLAGAFGDIPSPGEGQFVLHLWVGLQGPYFGCDAVFQPRGADGAYLARFQPLSLRGPDLAKNFTHTGMGNPSSWIYGPPAAYPSPQVVGPGETLAIDLTPAGDEGKRFVGDGKRLIGYVEMPEPAPSRAAAEAQLKNVTTPELQAMYARVLRADQELNAKVSETRKEISRQLISRPLPPRPLAPPAANISGAARDLSAEDAELDVTSPMVYINGALQGGRVQVQLRGPLPWLYLPGRGRFVLSLVPRPDFERAGRVEGRNLVIKSGEDTIALRCAGPITTEYETYIIYLRRDPNWEPDPAEQDHPLLGTLDPGEIKSDH